jgi:hypothetical protein
MFRRRDSPQTRYLSKTDSLSDTPGTGCLLTRLLFIIIIIIDNYPVNCSFSATLNLIFVRTRIVMRSLESGIKD